MALLALALVVRIALIVAQPDFTPAGDAMFYDVHGVSIAKTGHYPPSPVTRSGGPSAFRPPAYPYLLGAAYAVSGTSGNTSRWTVGRVVGAVLGVVTVALLGLVATMLLGPLAGLCAMALAAVYPLIVAVSDSLLSETLFTPLVLAAVACVLVLREGRAGYRWAVAAGALVGLAALTRSNGIVVVLPLLAGLWALGPRRRLRAGAALVCTMIVVLVPWLVRDALVFHRFIPITTQSGYALSGTYNDASRADPVNPAAWRVVRVPPYRAQLARRDLDEAELGQKLQTLGLKDIRKHPSYVAKVAFWNTARLLELTGRQHEIGGAHETGVGPTFSGVGRYAFWVVLALAAAGFVAVPALRRVPLFVWGVPAILFLSVVFVITSARYREPIDPFLLLAAAAPVAAAIAAARR